MLDAEKPQAHLVVLQHRLEDPHLLRESGNAHLLLYLLLEPEDGVVVAKHDGYLLEVVEVRDVQTVQPKLQSVALQRRIDDIRP